MREKYGQKGGGKRVSAPDEATTINIGAGMEHVGDPLLLRVVEVVVAVDDVVVGITIAGSSSHVIANK